MNIILFQSKYKITNICRKYLKRTIFFIPIATYILTLQNSKNVNSQNLSDKKNRTIYRLTYFNETALGEPIRLLFHYGNIPFIDNRVTKFQWKIIRSTPYGQVPVLQVDNNVINQSNAIARYIARLVKLNGNDPYEDLEIDAMVDNINDLRHKILDHYDETDINSKIVKRDVLIHTLPYMLQKLEFNAQFNQGYLVLHKLTWADIYFFGLLNYLNHMASSDLTKNFPNLTKVCNNVQNIPNIQKYLEKRPKTQY